MRSDLGHVRTVQELHYQNNNFLYANDITDLAGFFEASNRVTVVIDADDGTTWDASETHQSTPISFS